MLQIIIAVAVKRSLVSEGEVIYQSQDETRQIIVKYMQETPVINPTADKNWTFKPIVADKLITTFDSSPNAQNYIKKDGKISYVGPSEMNLLNMQLI